MTAKEILKKIKAVFDTADVAPADTGATGTVYTLQDGSQISIVQAGTVPAVGDMVSVSGNPAPAGDLVLQDGSTITCDATGAITAYTPAGGPVTTDIGAGKANPPAAAKPGAPATPVTPAQMAEMINKFATGTPEERLTNLELISKALMQSEFGWQILEQQRLADTNAAIAIYKNNLTAATQKIEAQEKVIAKHQATIKGVFDLMEKIVELPSADPKTLTGGRKERFEKKEAAHEKMAAAMKQFQEEGA